MEDIFTDIFESLDQLTVVTYPDGFKPYQIPQPSAPTVVPFAEVAHIRTLPSD
ncbi:hypothetical protein PTIM40_84 [Cyanophage P-TIM40]|uniref:Uncharacterized protein n=1 Tax=Cyanophage P-TIM40 TaxID=1589733 RepID=A0A0C5AAV3_9CAUD|nr:hypothetical protein [Nonlabens xiamenensis]YP_009188159.1 hypothetical protein AU107_gp084 [Cyanophage P-TIM40]AJK27511.1 hypothetical protein PTIM40_84 [Cyanophage P-TIM40]